MSSVISLIERAKQALKDLQEAKNKLHHIPMSDIELKNRLIVAMSTTEGQASLKKLIPEKFPLLLAAFERWKRKHQSGWHTNM